MPVIYDGPPYATRGRTKRHAALDRARAEVTGEELPPLYFTDTPVGRPDNSFGSYISPDYALTLDRERAALNLARDNEGTAMSGNALRRDQNAMTRRLMPHSEAAQLARLKLEPKQIAAEEELLPYQTENARSKYELGTEQNAYALEDLPDQDALLDEERRSKLEDLQNQDPHLARLEKMTKDEQDFSNYDHYLRKADPKLPPRERQRMALNQTMRLAQDRGVARELEEADPDRWDEFLEPVIDEETGLYLGTKLKDKVDRKEVAKILARHRNRKVLNAEAKEERMAMKDFNSLRLRALFDQQETQREILKNILLKESWPDAQAKLDRVAKDIEDLTLSAKPVPKPKTGEEAKETPVPAPKGDEKKIPPGTWTGKPWK